MNDYGQSSDTQLLTLIAGSDRLAFEALARRYSDALYDFALRVTLDPPAARAAVIAAFTRLGEEADLLPPGLSPRAWLLGLVRHEALSRLHRGRDEEDDSSTADGIDLARLPADHPLAADADIAAWAWQAARQHGARDYCLLDLAVRRSLTPEEVADVASMSRGASYTVIGRLRGFFEESFAAVLLYYRGREACPELDSIAESVSSLTPALRREIGRHAEGCLTCRRTRAANASPADLLAAFERVEADPSFLDALLESLPFVAPAEPSF